MRHLAVDFLIVVACGLLAVGYLLSTDKWEQE